MLFGAPYPQLAVLHAANVVPQRMALLPLCGRLSSYNWHQNAIANLHLGEWILRRPTIARTVEWNGNMLINVNHNSPHNVGTYLVKVLMFFKSIVVRTDDRTELHRTAQKRSLGPDNNGHTPIRGVRCPVVRRSVGKKHAPDRQEGNQPGATAGSWVALGEVASACGSLGIRQRVTSRQFDMRQ